MFKSIKTGVKALFFDDPQKKELNRLQIEVLGAIESLSEDMQSQLFVVERPLLEKRSPFADKLLFEEAGKTGVSYDPSKFVNPVAVGIGREGAYDGKVDISTLLHTSNKIKGGIDYTFNEQNELVEHRDGSNIYIMGVSDGIGIVRYSTFRVIGAHYFNVN